MQHTWNRQISWAIVLIVALIALFPGIALAEDIVGTDNPDSLVGTDEEDTITALAGDDRVQARSGIDVIYGDEGEDTLLGEDGDDLYYGGPDADFFGEVDPQTGDDTMLGQGGADFFAGGPGGDTIRGGNGDEFFEEFPNIFGDEGDDTLYGGRGDDGMQGEEGNDQLYGGKGDDLLDAADDESADSQDVVSCGLGDDTAIVNPEDKVAEDCENITEVVSSARVNKGAGSGDDTQARRQHQLAD